MRVRQQQQKARQRRQTRRAPAALVNERHLVKAAQPPTCRLSVPVPASTSSTLSREPLRTSARSSPLAHARRGEELLHAFVDGAPENIEKPRLRRRRGLRVSSEIVAGEDRVSRARHRAISERAFHCCLLFTDTRWMVSWRRAAHGRRLPSRATASSGASRAPRPRSTRAAHPRRGLPRATRETGWRSGQETVPDTLERVEASEISEPPSPTRTARQPARGRVWPHLCVACAADGRWSLEALLQEHRQDRFKVGEDDDGYAVYVKLKHFVRYSLETADDSPLYVFGSSFAEREATRSPTTRCRATSRTTCSSWWASGGGRCRWLVLGPLGQLHPHRPPWHLRMERAALGQKTVGALPAACAQIGGATSEA